MNIRKLKTVIDSIVQRLRDDEDLTVLISLADSSVGPRASAEVKYVGQGFDWEHGQFRIEPEVELIRKYKDRDIPRPIERMEFGGVKFNGCPRCGLRVAKDDTYCRHCGQRLTKPKRRNLDELS